MGAAVPLMVGTIPIEPSLAIMALTSLVAFVETIYLRRRLGGAVVLELSESHAPRTILSSHGNHLLRQMWARLRSI